MDGACCAGDLCLRAAHWHGRLARTHMYRTLVRTIRGSYISAFCTGGTLEPANRSLFGQFLPAPVLLHALCF